jgi:hypothetical protein
MFIVLALYVLTFCHFFDRENLFEKGHPPSLSKSMNVKWSFIKIRVCMGAKLGTLSKLMSRETNAVSLTACLVA